MLMPSDHLRFGRSVVAITLALVLAACNVAMAQVADDLYRAQTAVTGQGEANRMAGFAICLEDVLIKVSGAIRLAGDPRLNAYKSRAKDFVIGHSYRDQMSGTPTRDEQGTRDRPYDLTVEFDKAMIDGVLATLGLKPWLAQRPVLGVMIAMEPGARQYIVTSDSGQSYAPRQALRAAAAKRGMAIVLPSEAAPGKPGGDVALVGRLKWEDRALAWATEWQMVWQEKPQRWRFRSATFDDAFRRAIGDAAQIVSGNGAPATTDRQRR